MKRIVAGFALAFIFSMVLVNAHTITINFWNDLDKTNPYCNEFLKVYVQNQTSMGGFEYNYTCYRTDYSGCSATLLVNETKYYDLLITDGAVTWNNATGCPILVENYDIWSTAQSNFLIDGDMTLDYLINITKEGEPRQYFWATQSWRMMFSAIYFIVVGVLIIGVEYLIIKKTGGRPSPILAVIIFIIAVIIKLVLGI